MVLKTTKAESATRDTKTGLESFRSTIAVLTMPPTAASSGNNDTSSVTRFPVGTATDSSVSHEVKSAAIAGADSASPMDVVADRRKSLRDLSFITGLGLNSSTFFTTQHVGRYNGGEKACANHKNVAAVESNRRRVIRKKPK